MLLITRNIYICNRVVRNKFDHSGIDQYRQGCKKSPQPEQTTQTKIIEIIVLILKYLLL